MREGTTQQCVMFSELFDKTLGMGSMPPLLAFLLLELDTLVSPDTLMRWHRRLVAGIVTWLPILVIAKPE